MHDKVFVPECHQLAKHRPGPIIVVGICDTNAHNKSIDNSPTRTADMAKRVVMTTEHNGSVNADHGMRCVRALEPSKIIMVRLTNGMRPPTEEYILTVQYQMSNGLPQVPTVFHL